MTTSNETRAPYISCPTNLDLFAVNDESSLASTETNENHFYSLDEAIDCYTLGNFIHSHHNRSKRQRVDDVPTDQRPIAFVRFNSRMGKPKPVTLKALLDSGGGGTLVSKKFAAKLKVKRAPAQQVWTTPSGTMTTTAKVKAQFTMPELHDNRMIEWDVHVTKDLGAYDMIIG